MINNSQREIEKAETEFMEISLACYLYLRSNGLKKEFVESLLFKTLHRMNEYGEKKLRMEKKTGYNGQ